MLWVQMGVSSMVLGRWAPPPGPPAAMEYAGGAGGCAGDNAVAAGDVGEMALPSVEDIQADITCEMGPSRDDGVVEPHVGIHLTFRPGGRTRPASSAPPRRSSQSCQTPQARPGSPTSSSAMKSEASHVDAQHRESLCSAASLGQMQNGAVAAEGDDQVRAFQIS